MSNMGWAALTAFAPPYHEASQSSLLWPSFSRTRAPESIRVMARFPSWQAYSSNGSDVFFISTATDQGLSNDSESSMVYS